MHALMREINVAEDGRISLEEWVAFIEEFGAELLSEAHAPYIALRRSV